MKLRSRTVCSLGGLFLLACVIAVPAAAQGKAKGAAAKEQVWQVEFATNQDTYTGTMTLTVTKGVVTGKMLLDAPTKIEAMVEGTQASGTITLDYPYTMVEQNCTGRVKAEAKLAAKGEEASGPFTATGCSEEPVQGTLTMKKGTPPAK